jgi:polysaccharide deacetylase 2 family uncharacterized protein YibQ
MFGAQSAGCVDRRALVASEAAADAAQRERSGVEDDLSKPLGKRVREVRPAQLVPWLGALLIVVFSVVGLWALLGDDPLGGEPVAVSAIARALPPEPKLQPKPTAAEAAAAERQAMLTAADADTPKSGPVIIKVPGAAAAAARSAAAPQAANSALLEPSKYGSLPRIADDGRRPSELYARGVAAGDDKRPKVALLIGGLGIGAGGSDAAITRMPAEVTLGFTPYASDLDQWVDRARAAGHEVVLQVPMEPFDYPNNDPGPQALLTSLPAAANIDRLKWAMARVGGYVGIGNYMGARFTATEDAIRPVLTEAARRGLLFVDDGASPRSLVARLGPGLGAPVVRAEVVIDAVPTAADIDAALSRLEDLARREGTAVAVASAQPVTLARIEAWAKTLDKRGIALVPVSAAVKRRDPA